jgi:hypothetical protein
MCRAVGIATLVLLGSVAAWAQDFSADILVVHDEASALVAHLAAHDGKVRIETTEHPDGFFLTDAAKPSAYFVRPAARGYMDAKQSSALTRLFVPVDPDAPCPQWQNMARDAGMGGEGDWRCERTGEATIDGRATIAFQVSPADGHGYLAWVDPVRKFPLKIKTEDGVVTALEALRDEPQAASSFELPANLARFRPEALIELIKQSDVWVTPQEATEAAHR